MRLVEAVAEPAGRRVCRMRPAAEIGQALRLAYAAPPDAIERCQRGLAAIARLMNAGEQAQAAIRAVQLAVPEIAPKAMVKLAQAASLQKDNLNRADEPRVPAANPDGGEWTDDGGAGGGDANIRPASAPLNPIQEKKERFAHAHLADTQKAADQLGIPVENILGLSALESGWGSRPFAAQGSNYFGIHYLAPYATGYMQAKRGPAKIATFASYADSLKSFITLSESIVRARAIRRRSPPLCKTAASSEPTRTGLRSAPMFPRSPQPSAGFMRSSRGVNVDGDPSIRPVFPEADWRRDNLL
ncbi:MAG: glucosaminidase domain-containing protein [Stellaceae bacterium]